MPGKTWEEICEQGVSSSRESSCDLRCWCLVRLLLMYALTYDWWLLFPFNFIYSTWQTFFVILSQVCRHWYRSRFVYWRHITCPLFPNFLFQVCPNPQIQSQICQNHQICSLFRSRSGIGTQRSSSRSCFCICRQTRFQIRKKSQDLLSFQILIPCLQVR